MTSAYSHVRPNAYLFLQLPTETLKLVEIKLNTIIDVGKLGCFPCNLLVGRPYYHTYELLERRDGELFSRLRIVSQAELNTEAGLDDAIAAAEDADVAASRSALPEGHNLLDEAGIMKTNRLTVDDATRQALSQAEIEELKKTSGGKEVIERIMANHTGLEEKTVFSKAKYALRKHKKYLKRFSVLPMDLGNLITYVTDKEATRILSMREEALGLIGAWSNAHYSGLDGLGGVDSDAICAGRWLAADDTGGLVTAMLAERMGILHPPSSRDTATHFPPGTTNGISQTPNSSLNGKLETSNGPFMDSDSKSNSSTSHRDFPIPVKRNTITILHPAVQPNLSLLKYFGYDTANPSIPSIENEHPLHTHLKPLSWLQFLSPGEDSTSTEPDVVSEETLASWKSGKRGAYYKKRRRWARCRAIIEDTQAGDFDGLVVASHMDPVSIMQHAIPLVRGGGYVVVYSATVEPLVRLVDFYSKERKSAYIQLVSQDETPDPDEFPLDPRMLLGPMLQTSRVRDWQVLPGRTHPLMTSPGGAEGYVFTARKVIPLEGVVEGRGKFASKRRKVVTEASTECRPVDAIVPESIP